MLEDLDLSYRIGRDTQLSVVPDATLIHRRSPKNRLDAAQYHTALILHRRWFVEKHFASTSARLAYWWSTFGLALGLLVSSTSSSFTGLRGLLRGAWTVWWGSHPLLFRYPDPQS